MKSIRHDGWRRSLALLGLALAIPLSGCGAETLPTAPRAQPPDAEAETSAALETTRTPVPFTSVAKGRYSGYWTSVEFAITSQEAFDVFWPNHRSGQFINVPKPVIDFEKEMMLGLIRYYSPYTGRALTIESVGEVGGEVVVNALVTRAGFGCTERIDDIQLHEYFTVPRSELPIRFVVDEELAPPCYPLPEWPPTGRTNEGVYVVPPSDFLDSAEFELIGRPDPL